MHTSCETIAGDVWEGKKHVTKTNRPTPVKCLARLRIPYQVMEDSFGLRARKMIDEGYIQADNLKKRRVNCHPSSQAIDVDAFFLVLEHLFPVYFMLSLAQP